MSTVTDLIFRVLGQKDASFDATMKSVEERADQSINKLTSSATKLSIAFGAISLTSGLMLKGFIDNASAMETYRAKLVTVLKDQQKATDTLEWAVKFAAETPFEVKGIVDATVNLEVYGVSAQKWIPLVGDLAAGMNMSIEDTSRVIGKALTGSLEGFESLRNLYGISSKELEKYGATLTKMGGISVQTAKDLEKAQKALEAIISDKFEGGMKRLEKTFTGSMSSLSDAINKLKTSIGEEMLPTLTPMVRELTKFVELLNKLPAPVKASAGYLTLATLAMSGAGLMLSGLVITAGNFVTMIGGTAGLNIMLTQMGAEVKILTSLLGPLRIALMSVITACGGWVTILLAIGAASLYVIDQTKKVEKALGDMITVEGNLIQKSSQWRREWSNMSAQDLLTMGVTIDDLKAAYQGLIIQQGQANTPALKAKYAEMIKVLMGQIKAVQDLGTAQEEQGKTAVKEVNKQIETKEKSIDVEGELTSAIEERYNKQQELASWYYDDVKDLSENNIQSEIQAIDTILKTFQLAEEDKMDWIRERSKLERDAERQKLEATKQAEEEIKDLKATAREREEKTTLKEADTKGSLDTGKMSKYLGEDIGERVNKVNEEIKTMKDKGVAVNLIKQFADLKRAELLEGQKQLLETWKGLIDPSKAGLVSGIKSMSENDLKRALINPELYMPKISPNIRPSKDIMREAAQGQNVNIGNVSINISGMMNNLKEGSKKATKEFVEQLSRDNYLTPASRRT